MAAGRAERGDGERKTRITARAREFALPPVRDALVIGRRSPVGCLALQRALGLLSTAAFESIEIPDHPTISDFIVRQDILRRVSREQLVEFVIQRLAPLLGDTEILHLELEIVIELEAGL